MKATSTISSWKVTSAYANGQTVSNTYGANVVQSGASVTATNMSYNACPVERSEHELRRRGTWSGTNSVPTLSCS